MGIPWVFEIDVFIVLKTYFLYRFSRFIFTIYYIGIQVVTRDDRGLQGVTGDYKRLQEVTRGFNESRGDTRGSEGVTSGYREFHRVTLNFFSK